MDNNRTNRFRLALTATGMSQSDAASTLGLSGQSRISEYLRGVRDPSEAITRHLELEAGIRAPHITPQP